MRDESAHHLANKTVFALPTEPPPMKQLILRNFQSPGDIVMLTAAVRDLHLTYPSQFVTDVRTSCPAIWENNPYLTPLSEDDTSIEIVDCEYPLINQSNSAPYHFIHGFIAHLNERLGLCIRPTVFRGDVHISPLEKTWFSQVEEIVHWPQPFWIVVAGGKRDYTIKWWHPSRFQQVIDYFRGRILFVQVGESEHVHPPLRNVIDLRGKTDLRQLIRLVYHAQGVLCPVTLLMHLAAAIETKPDASINRPCVVVAGGREPPHWEAYPHHQFLHRVGALRCCESGGCWKSRVVPLGDGDEKDRPENCCVDVIGDLPRCMDLITAKDVIRAIEVHFNGGAVSYLSPREPAQYRTTVVAY
jgi:ADP-heptose:LPS heptosyltransferase